ncbi:cysteine--tRNA ligase [Trifolium repens]|nr:cysteine--tRNA ligase [Trifolium repens]
MVTLNCLPPTVEPKVSDHMPQIIDMIELRRRLKNELLFEYKRSRTDLAIVGVALMDSPNGTTWRPSIPLPLQEQL